MPNSTLNIAELNPVKFYSETLLYPENYLTRFIDDFTFQNQIKSYEGPATYFQKWMPQEVIHLQIETDFDDLKLEVVGCNDLVYKSVIPQTVISAIDPSPLDFRNVSVTLDDLPTGIYYLRFKITVNTAVKYYTSEPQEIAKVVPNSVLYHYASIYNEFDVAFDTGIVFQFRCEGAITDFKPGNRRKIYEDQNLNNVRLSATPYRAGKLIIGGPEGVPNWVADKLNRIFCCDYISIDGTEYVRLDGDMEPKREEYYAMSGWSFDIREAKNKLSKQFRLFLLFGLLDYDGVAVIDIDNQPMLYG
jgi:hypothetical protein